jgi:hypothetical protein
MRASQALAPKFKNGQFGVKSALYVCKCVVSMLLWIVSFENERLNHGVQTLAPKFEFEKKDYEMLSMYASVYCLI